MAKIKVSDSIERNFFSLTVSGVILLAGDVHSSVTMDRHVQAWQWTGSISLLTWGLLWASICSLEVWNRNGVSLEKCVSLHTEWLLKSLAAGVVAPLSYYPQAWSFIKKESLSQLFSCEFFEIFKNTFSCRTPPVAVSES